MWRIAFFFTILGCAFAQKAATVSLSDPTKTNNVTGSVNFVKTSDGITVIGTVSGLTPGNHGFHIHTLGVISPDCAASGAHFNPENHTHGAPTDTNRHAGDLGNIFAGADGIALINITDSVIDLEGTHNIIGRAVVVHELEDDLGKGGYDDSLTTGHAGGRLVCGVILTV
ncbi:superoxide dismutase [Cu-Zn], chloroplastic isoform X2 [Anoplophora glabripennis]|uniref:superoxide dismutase [Cu-Zn], chloroplastic isoform X2 n=1 Tax=Anoplophora glabripennis TaxID=217634 RepID=UPI0008745437|nr:superoxide dismutase [Cu-Zn], chloroplastic isoform X2 [Anoplophora glabripennis]